MDALVVLNLAVQRYHAYAEPEVYRVADADAIRAWMEEYLGQPDREVWLSIDGADAAPLGYAAFRHGVSEATPFVHARNFVYVDQLGVREGARRHGVGRALMEAVRSRARALGADAIELDVRAINHAARDFYEALGYRPSKLLLRRAVD
ncbi:MAG: GNAT family N-acetyltransferase [Sandaracinaceae bacterium]